MKKIFCVLLSIIILLSCTSCNYGSSSENALSEAQTRVLSVWIKFLGIEGRITEGVIRASDYIEDYCSAPCIEGYRHSLISSQVLYSLLSDIDAMEKPLWELTEEDYEAMSASGTDVSFLKGLLQVPEKTIPLKAEIWRLLRDTLFNEAFFKEGIEYLSEAVRQERTEAEINSRYYSLVTNYLLLLSGMSSYPDIVINGSNGLITENTVFLDSAEKINTEIALCSDRLSLLAKEEEKLSALRDSVSAVYKKVNESESVSELYDSAVDWGKETTCFPLGKLSFTEVSCYYYTQNEDGEDISPIKAGDKLEALETDYSLHFAMNDKDEYKEYISYLVENSCEYAIEKGSFDEEGEMVCIIRSDEQLFRVYRDESSISIYFDTDECFFCPSWYFDFCRAEQ